MHVQVKYDLAAGAFIELLDSHPIGIERGTRSSCDLLHDLDHMREVIRRDVEYVPRSGFRQHQSMTGRAGHYVQECE